MRANEEAERQGAVPEGPAEEAVILHLLCAELLRVGQVSEQPEAGKEEARCFRCDQCGVRLLVGEVIVSTLSVPACSLWSP